MFWCFNGKRSVRRVRMGMSVTVHHIGFTYNWSLGPYLYRDNVGYTPYYPSPYQTSAFWRWFDTYMR